MDQPTRQIAVLSSKLTLEQFNGLREALNDVHVEQFLMPILQEYYEKQGRRLDDENDDRELHKLQGDRRTLRRILDLPTIVRAQAKHA